jgi:hypothetical protein
VPLGLIPEVVVDAFSPLVEAPAAPPPPAIIIGILLLLI